MARAISQGSDVDQVPQGVQVRVITHASLYHRATYDIRNRQYRVHAATLVTYPKLALNELPGTELLQDVEVALIHRAARFESDIRARHVGKMWQQVLEALASMTAIARSGVVVDHHQAAHW